MTFQINPSYLSAVSDFQWPQGVPSPSSTHGIVSVVAWIYAGALALIQEEERYTAMAGREVSFKDRALHLVEELDQTHGISTPDAITALGDEERAILWLSPVLAELQSKIAEHTSDERLKRLTEEELKVATLLFGAKRIHEFAILPPIDLPTELEAQIVEATETIQEMELTLSRLIAVRERFSAEVVAASSPDAMGKVSQVDGMIDKTTIELQGKRQFLISLKQQLQDLRMEALEPAA